MNNYQLVEELIKMPTETAWVEFKHDNYNPEMIGQDICALANSATLHEKNSAYMVWGIHDRTHEIIGTNYNLQTLKKGEQEIENWLRSLLSDNVMFSFDSVNFGEKTVGILTIDKAMSFPAKFQKIEYIRIGSYTRKLKDVPSVESSLWDRIKNEHFENQVARMDCSINDILNDINYVSYFDLQSIPVPANQESIVHYLIEDGIIAKQDNGLFSITNMGAILFAKSLASFDRLSRKALRIIQYDGNNRLLIKKESSENSGYASGFEGIMKYIDALLPSEEIIGETTRNKKSVYPIVAVRETIANALIHQDLSISGTGPIVEIFDSRIEISNSGTPLVDIDRIIDNPPKSRNEKLASIMRRLRLCEELGSGWDRIVILCEIAQLPAPKIEECSGSTRVTLFAEKAFTDISPEDRMRACYLHACIKQVQGEQLTNNSLRTRFGVKESSSASISRLIKDAVDARLIKPLDPTTAPRYMKYIPFWA